MGPLTLKTDVLVSAVPSGIEDPCFFLNIPSQFACHFISSHMTVSQKEINIILCKLSV